MFTFSFSSAFAATPTPADAAQRAEIAQKEAALETQATYFFGLAKEEMTASTYDSATNLGYQVEPSLIKDLLAGTTVYDAFVKATITDLADAARADYESTWADGITINQAAVTNFIKTNYKWILVKQQLNNEMDAVLADLANVDYSVYSTTTPTTGDTYFEIAQNYVKDVADYAEAQKYEITNSPISGDLDAEHNPLLGTITHINLNLPKSATTGLRSIVVDSESKVTFVNGDKAVLKTKKAEDESNADDAVAIAEAKAAIQRAYATYMKNEGADKAKADAYVTVCNFLAEEDILRMDSYSVSTGTDYTDAVALVENLTAYAEVAKKEINAAGTNVRDAEEIDDIVYDFTVAAYKHAAMGTSAADIAAARESIDKKTIASDAAALVFKKEAKKSDLLEEKEALEERYPLEQAIIDAAYDAALTAVDASADETALNKVKVASIAKALTKEAINAKFEQAPLQDTFNAQLEALQSYVKYKNIGLSGKDANYVVADTLKDDLKAFYGEKGARTVAEMKALSAEASSVVDALPTIGSIAAKKADVEAAIATIPATVTVADKDTIEAAWKAMNEYVEMIGGDDWNAASDVAGKATLLTKMGNLNSALVLDLSKKVSAVNLKDKAAVKALSDEIEAFNDLKDEDALLEGIGTTYTSKAVDDALAGFRKAELKAVNSAIAALPTIITEADKAAVEAARKLYDAYVEEYTDVDAGYPAGYAAGDVVNYRKLEVAEATLGLNNNPEENAKAYVQDLSIKARSVKTSKGVKVTINADVQPLLDDGFTVEYKFYRSEYSNKKFGTAKVTKTENTYLNTAGTKGTRYYYKAKLVVKNAAGEVVATTPLTQCLYATRVF